MRRNTADLNDEWLDEALQAFATCQQAREIIAAFDSVNMDFAGSAEVWRYGGGRDLSSIAEDGRVHVPGGSTRIP